MGIRLSPLLSQDYGTPSLTTWSPHRLQLFLKKTCDLSFLKSLLLISLLLFMHYMFKGDLLCFFDFYDLLTFLEWLIVMFNHTKVSNNDVHAFRCIPCWQSRVAVQSAKHSGQQHLRFICSHFREIIYVEALLPRPHMPGQICPRACFKEGNQSHRSLNLNETNVICLILVKLILFL